MILATLKRAFLRKSKSTVGIDIGTTALKLVELSWKDQQPILQNYHITPIPASMNLTPSMGEDNDFSELLNNALAISGMRSRNANFAVGGHNLFVREVSFPTMTEKELKEAIKWDMEKYVPYEPETYYYDYSILPNELHDDGLKVLLAAVPRKRLDSLIQVVKQAGLTPQVVDIEALSIHRTVSHMKNGVILDIGGHYSQILLFQQGIPVINRTIPLGGERFFGIAKDLKQEKLTNFLLSEQAFTRTAYSVTNEDTDSYQSWQLLINELEKEVLRTIEYYQIQNAQAIIDQIVMVGGGARVPCLHLSLSKYLDFPVNLHNPLLGVKLSPSFDVSYLNSISPQLSLAVGLALRGGNL